MKCEKCGAPVGFSRHHFVGLPPSFRNSDLVDAWKEYRQFMMEKYPANEGETWEFTRQHLKKLDDLFREADHVPGFPGP